MTLIYIQSESTVKPSVIEIGPTTVYIRKDIAEEVRTSENGNDTTYWVYREATMSIEDFNSYTNELSVMNSINIGSIVESGEDNTNNQLILMEAIADLYDVIASMM